MGQHPDAVACAGLAHYCIIVGLRALLRHLVVLFNGDKQSTFYPVACFASISVTIVGKLSSYQATA